MGTFPENLLSGYRNFIDGRFSTERERYRELAREGQKPRTLVIACCDSRAAPETIFDSPPGELFVVRNVANLVPPYGPDGSYHGTSAALEYAIHSLEVTTILVLGHGRCGGIQAALDPSAGPLSAGDFIGKWMSLLEPVAGAVSSNELLTTSERQTALERISIRHSIANLRSFPRIAELEAEGKLQVCGAWFDILSGELWIMDPETGDFERPEAD